jgi:hypothetical protein
MAKKQAKKKPEVKKVEAVSKPTPAPKKEAVKLEDGKLYDFVVPKDTKHMKKGTYIVDGAMCKILIKKGLGSVKS